MQSSTSTLVTAYLFGAYRLVIADRILECHGERVCVTPKVIDTLFVLIQNAPHVVSKEALMQAVWPDVTVVESGLTRNISALRKALKTDPTTDSYIETVPRHGYRFIAEVTEERTAQQSPIHFPYAAAAAVLVVVCFLLLHHGA